MSSAKDRAVYQPIALNGRSFPVPCDECGRAVTAFKGRYGESFEMTGVVHHRDEDKSNNTLENLSVLHHSCHVRLHSTGRVVSDESRAKMATPYASRPRSSDAQARLNEALRGRAIPNDVREQIRTTVKSRRPCPDCGGMYNPVWMTRHRNLGKCRS